MPYDMDKALWCFTRDWNSLGSARYRASYAASNCHTFKPYKDGVDFMHKACRADGLKKLKELLLKSGAAHPSPFFAHNTRHPRALNVWNLLHF